MFIWCLVKDVDSTYFILAKNTLPQSHPIVTMDYYVVGKFKLFSETFLVN